jgi:hypothetical protein
LLRYQKILGIKISSKTQKFNHNILFSIVAGATWPNLRVTFGLNPFGGYFYPYPITAGEAAGAGWEKISSCGDGTWMGDR